MQRKENAKVQKEYYSRVVKNDQLNLIEHYGVFIANLVALLCVPIICNEFSYYLIFVCIIFTYNIAERTYIIFNSHKDIRENKTRIIFLSHLE